MRRSIVIALCAWCCGFLAASATAFGYAKLNAWREQGPSFQLGYVVGFIDAVTLWKRKDPRAYTVPIGGRPNYEEWRDKVNAYFADPVNEKRAVPDAMGAIGSMMSLERLKAWRDREARTPNGAPSPGASVGAGAAAAARDDEDGSPQGAPPASRTPADAHGKAPGR